MGLGALVVKGVCTALRDLALRGDARTLRVLVGEVCGIVRSLPYALNCAVLRARRPPPMTIGYDGRRPRRGRPADRGGDRRRIDMYYCEPGGGGAEGCSSAGPRPMVLFVHGGAWGSGERWQYTPLAWALAREAGAIVGIVGYRLYPEAMVDEQVTDVRLAMREFCIASRALGADENRYALVGHSSGAHLSCLALLRGGPQDAADEGGPPAAGPSSFVGISGVYDIATHYEYEKSRGVDLLSPMHDAFGGAGGFRDASPTQLVADRAPDAPEIDLSALPSLSLLVDSRGDEVVKSVQSRAFGDALRDRLRAEGIADKRVANASYADVSHAGFVTDWTALASAWVLDRAAPAPPEHCADLVRLVAAGPPSAAPL